MMLKDNKWLRFLVLILVCLTWTGLLVRSLVMEERSTLILLVGLGPALILGAYLFLDPDNFLYALIFFVPLSVREDLPGGFSVSFPAEVMAVLVLLHVLANADRLKVPDRRIFSHPVFLLLLVQLLWLMISSLLGSMPLVSFKRTIIQVLYASVFFFLFFTRFTSQAGILRFYALYALGMVVPIINGFAWHSQYHFSQPSSYYMPQPFFIEHTIYGAALAFLIPPLFYLAFIRSESNRSISLRIFFGLLFLLCLTAEFLAYSRAAWMSLLSVPLILLVFRYRIRIPYILAGTALIAVILFINSETVTRFLDRNESSSNRNNLEQQLESVSNIQTDISNLERINRWKCALRMFREKPLTGFGPGTYQFEYGSFQLKTEMTRISTYHGEKGNAHSEYLGALAETGIPGFLIYLSVILATLWYALRIIYRTHDSPLRKLTITVTLCLVPFYLHTIFNGFLENDEIGSLYYGSLAAVVALDLYFYRKPLHGIS